MPIDVIETMVDVFITLIQQMSASVGFYRVNRSHTFDRIDIDKGKEKRDTENLTELQKNKKIRCEKSIRQWKKGIYDSFSFIA